MQLSQNQSVDARQIFHEDIIRNIITDALDTPLGTDNLASIMASAKEGLLNLCTEIGITVVE